VSDLRLAEQIADGLGLDLTADGPAPGGQGRTFYGRLAGRPVAVKWGLDPDLPEKIPYVAAQAGELRRRGCPVPAVIACGRLDEARYAWVMERLPGKSADRLDAVLLGQLVSLIGRMAGAPARPHRRHDDGYDWVPGVVFDDDAGWWRTAAGMGPDVVRFCRRLRAWVGSERPAARHDYVHLDLNLSNVLVAGGRITGIVDLETLGVGDRAVDVATLAFDWLWLERAGRGGQAPDAFRTLVALGHEVSTPAGWRTAVAYLLIARLGWRSDHEMAIDPMDEFPVCEDFLDAVERSEDS